VYEGQSLASPILGTKESLAPLKSDDFKRYMKRFYVPERTVVGICGNFDEEKILSLIEEYFGNDENTAFALSDSEPFFKECFTVKKRSFEQNHIMLSFKGVGIDHEDLYKLMVCSFILGSGTSSRLNQRIREELGLVYEISSYLSRFSGGGYICVHMSLTADSEEKGIEETCKIIRELSSTITEKELSTAKEKLTASLIMSREQPQSKLSYLGHCQLFLDKFIEDDNIIEKIKSVTLEDVSSVAKKYLDLKSASFTAVGNVKDCNFYKGLIKGE
jgi:predicted Zn-dependent peptidase